MSRPTLAPLAAGRASAAASRPRDDSILDREIAVPMYTRHTRGTIEADRDRRRGSRAARTFRHVRRPAMPHPSIAAALAARPQAAIQSPLDELRWVDEGGWFDPDAVGRLRIGDREMKRCNA
jgi:hypothetical protein